MLVDEGRFVGGVGEDADARDVPAGVVVDRRAGAEQALNVLRHRDAEAHGNPVGVHRVARLLEFQAAQTPLGRGIDVHRAVHRHLPSVRRVHADFVRPAAPQVRHLARTWHRDEGAESGPQHVFTQHRVRVQPQFGSAEEAEAQVQHLQRQAVAQRLFVLAHEAAALEDGEQAMHRRRGLAKHPRQVGDAEPRCEDASASQMSSAFSSDVCLPDRSEDGGGNGSGASDMIPLCGTWFHFH